MKKALPFFLLAAVCAALVFHYSGADFPSLTSASEEDSGAVVEINQPLQHAVMPSLAGEWVNMESYKGKVVLINFWTTWCPGCRDEMPDLIRLQNDFGSKGFTVVAVAVDDEGEESVQTYAQTERFDVNGSSLPMNFPILLGHDELARKIGFEGGLPASVLVNRDGQEVKLIRGPVHAQQISKLIKRLL